MALRINPQAQGSAQDNAQDNGLAQDDSLSASSRTRAIEVERYDFSSVGDRSIIPEAVLDFLDRNGKVFSFASRNPDYIAGRSLYFSHPIVVEIDVNAEDRDRFKLVCRREGLNIDPLTGMVTRGDCCIFAQPEGARDEEMRIATRQEQAQRWENTDTDALLGGIPREYRERSQIRFDERRPLFVGSNG